MLIKMITPVLCNAHSHTEDLIQITLAYFRAQHCTSITKQEMCVRDAQCNARRV